MYKKGLGTTGYRDSWSLFDQILVTKPLLRMTIPALDITRQAF